LGLADELVPRLITDGGVCLSDTIYIQGFGAQDTITLSSNIEYLFANMEHSYLGDITIRLICPDSSSIMIQQQYGGGAYLGEPIDDAFLNPGLGYNYIWSNNSTNGTWSSQAVSTIPSGTYNPVQTFADLIGCPINGSWVLEICDLGANDNGFLFDWDIRISNN
jgi:subtilisin-like proprotein convertase family protein